jgi:hypothetical protein
MSAHMDPHRNPAPVNAAALSDSAHPKLNLPADVSRCLGLGCARKVTCRRYLEYRTGRVFSESLCDDGADGRIPAL